MTMTGNLDGETVRKSLAGAELYWLTTVRGDGRPHVTPLVGVWFEDSFVFCTGLGEQKAHDGLDIVVAAKCDGGGIGVAKLLDRHLAVGMCDRGAESDCGAPEFATQRHPVPGLLQERSVRCEVCPPVRRVGIAGGQND
jgi:hypothetical protein